jgi:hypothetical protein
MRFEDGERPSASVWEPPTLTVVGTLKRITQAGVGSQADGGGTASIAGDSDSATS